MSYDENRISDQIDGGLHRQEEYNSMLSRLIDSHFNLFRRLNQLNNKMPLDKYIQESLIEAREINRFFSDPSSPKIVQSKTDNNENAG